MRVSGKHVSRARARKGGASDALLLANLRAAGGLRPRIEKMADRIAAQGYVVLAPNVFYRAGHAPLWEMPDVDDPDSRGRFFRTLGPLMGALTPVAVAADGGAYLDKLGELAAGPAGATGYCFGARGGWLIPPRSEEV